MKMTKEIYQNFLDNLDYLSYQALKESMTMMVLIDNILKRNPSKISAALPANIFKTREDMIKDYIFMKTLDNKTIFDAIESLGSFDGGKFFTKLYNLEVDGCDSDISERIFYFNPDQKEDVLLVSRNYQGNIITESQADYDLLNLESVGLLLADYA